MLSVLSTHRKTRSGLLAAIASGGVLVTAGPVQAMPAGITQVPAPPSHITGGQAIEHSLMPPASLPIPSASLAALEHARPTAAPVQASRLTANRGPQPSAASRSAHTASTGSNGSAAAIALVVVVTSLAAGMVVQSARTRPRRPVGSV
jgi:hypothetical protein